MNKKRILIFICGLIDLLFICLGINLLNKHQEDCWLHEPMLYNSMGEIEAGNPYFASAPSTVYCKTSSLESGVYHVTVSYQTEGESFLVSCRKEEIDGYSYPVIYADEHLLNPVQEEISFTIWINGDVDDLEVYFKWGDEILNNDSLYIGNIVLTRDYGESVLYGMVKLLMYFVVFHIVVGFVWYWDIVKKRILMNFWVILGLGCIFVVSSMGMLMTTQPWGHDISFHCARIAGLAEGLKTGSFPVRMQPGWNNGYGYPVSIYYGDIFLYVPAFLYLLQVPIVYAYKVYVLIVNLGRVLISYYCFRKLSHDKLVGVVCSALYSLSVNYILNLYLRAAVGEYTASVFFPLIILGLVEILLPEKDKEKRKGWPYLCVGITGVIQSHVLSTEMVCLLIAISLIIMLPRVLCKDSLTALCKSVLVALGLNAGFLIPFLDYSREDVGAYADKAQYGIQNFGLNFYELFSMPTKGIGQAGNAVDGIVFRIPEALGIPFIMIILVAGSLCIVYDDWKEGERKRMLTALGLAGLVCFMSTVYCPWNFLAVVPIVQKMVASIQFPWRFLSVATAILTYVACLLFIQLKKCLTHGQYRIALMGMCFICAIQGMYTIDLVVRDISVGTVYDGNMFLDRQKAVSGGEYLLSDSSAAIAFQESDISGTGIEISDVEWQGTTVTLSCSAVEEACLEVPLFAYDYYRCIDVESEKIYPCLRGSNGKINIVLPSGYDGRLKISFVEPWYWRVSELISIITLVGCVLIYFRQRKLSKSNQRRIRC